MKKLLGSILIMMAISSASYAAVTKTVVIEELVCLSVSGCSIDMTDGSCPDCVIKIRKLITTIDEPVVKIKTKVVRVKATPVIIAKNTSPSSPERCFFPKLGMSGKWRDCLWKKRGSITAAAVARGIIECGEIMNWVWLDRHHSKYKCKG